MPEGADWLTALSLGKKMWDMTALPKSRQGEENDMEKWSVFSLYNQRRVVDAADISRGVINLFCTPDYRQGGKEHYPVGGPYLYEEWEIMGAICTLITATSGIREGCKIRIQAVSGDVGANHWDFILADEIQKHYKYASFVGPLVVPFGIYGEIDQGGFKLGDVMALIVSYRKALK